MRKSFVKSFPRPLCQDFPQSLSHSIQIVWISKYRRKALYGLIRQHLGGVIRELARQGESQVLEEHVCPDPAHVYIAIPPKYAVAQVVGYIKGKSTIHIARIFGGRSRNFTGEHFWARGYLLSCLSVTHQCPIPAPPITNPRCRYKL